MSLPPRNLFSSIERLQVAQLVELPIILPLVHQIQYLSTMDFFLSTDFQAQVELMIKQHHVPGIAVAIVQDGKISSAGYGQACLDPSEPCTPDTLFDIASCSKSFTAASIGLLVEDEKHPEVQYSAMMSSLLPDDFVMPKSEYTDGVTLDDVLGHTTGMGRSAIHTDTCFETPFADC